MQRSILSLLFLLTAISPALATSGPGCLVVVNVASYDALNLRASPSASARIVDKLRPGRHGIIHLDGACRPKSVAWGSRWCPVTHYNGDKVTKGWVKARYVRDSDCP
jgi:Bacterial SH3 domain